MLAFMCPMPLFWFNFITGMMVMREDRKSLTDMVIGTVIVNRAHIHTNATDQNWRIAK